MSLGNIIDAIISPISLIVGDKIGHAITGVVLAGIGIATGQLWLVGLGLSLASGSLLGPATPKMPKTSPSDRLYATLDPSSPRKWVFGGPTAMATDVRYQTFTGSDQDTYWQVICVASHEVQSIDEIWLDNEKAWSAGAVQGRYVNYMTVTVRTLGTSANGVAIDSTWTSSCTLTGCAYVVISFKLTGNSNSEDSPFAGGVTNRVTIRGKGAKVYDPRLDTTVTGGSGSQRAATQSTWAWDANASRNPALQLLWYLLGWDINSKLALGMGLPPARLDLPSFITAANACDESVTLNGGGTEPRYRCDGVMSEGDDRQAVIESLCSMMFATLRDAGGKLALTVMHNDLSTPVASFTEGDILEGGGKWAQTLPLSQSFNIVRGRRIDPSDTALYQPVDFPEVPLTSPDGIDRIDTVEYQFVQSNGQAQRLAKQRLQRNQYQGRYSFTGGERWWQVNIGDVVQLSHQSYGWANKLFRLVEQRISRTGATGITLLEENAAIYAWANNEAAAVTPGTPTVYDPTNSPILTGIRERRVTTGNMLTDTAFSRKWILSAGAVRALANATGGYAQGAEQYYLELSPSSTLIRSALSELVRVNPGQKYYFGFRAQRGTTLGSGSRLNAGGQWLGSDGTTVVGSFTEGPQQTPTGLTAGALPVEVNWSGTAPATAYYVQLKPYTPALASSSGTFRVERPWVSITDPGGAPSVGYGPTSYAANYAADGTALTGELPFDLVYQMYLGAVAQSAGVTWTYKVITGGINSKTPASGSQSMTGTGPGTLTVSTLEYDSSTIQITATAANGSIATATVVITKAYAAPTTSGGASGDSPSQSSGFTSINSTTFTVISNTLTYTVPTGQTSITATVGLAFKPITSGGAGSWTVEMKVQRNISGVWTDQGATFSGGTEVDVDAETGALIAQRVTLSGTRQSTGLTAGVQYQERIVARLTSGTRSHTITGSVSVAAP